MAKYRKIDPRIWNDAKFRSLGDDGQLAFLFILTHPSMTALGAMRATIEGLAAEKGWQAGRMSDAIGHAMRHGMLEANGEACYMGVPNFLRYNPPEGPNSVSKAWLDALDLIPECPEKLLLIGRSVAFLKRQKPEYIKQLGGSLDAMRHAMRDGMSDPSGMPCPIQEQEQEQEQEKDINLPGLSPVGTSAPVSPSPRKNPRVAAKLREAPERYLQGEDLDEFRLVWLAWKAKASEIEANPGSPKDGARCWSEILASCPEVCAVHLRYAGVAFLASLTRYGLPNIETWYGAGRKGRWNEWLTIGAAMAHETQEVAG